MASWSGYYTGKGEAATKIARMVTQGKNISRKERSRWQQNRMIYRGDQWVRARPGSGFSSGRLEVLTDGVNGRKRDTFNRLRQMTDGRVSTLTGQRPPYEVVPKSREQQVIDAARQAQKLIAAKWGERGWGVDSALREMVLTGEIDGVSFLSVIFDPHCGEETVIYVDQSGQPIASREQYEALTMQDATGGTLWKDQRVRMGEVVWRVVRPGAIATDPSATHWKDVNWIIESRVLPRAKIELENKVDIDKMLHEQSNRSGSPRPADLSIGPVVSEDEGNIGDKIVPGSEEYIIHEMLCAQAQSGQRAATRSGLTVHRASRSSLRSTPTTTSRTARSTRSRTVATTCAAVARLTSCVQSRFASTGFFPFSLTGWRRSHDRPSLSR